MTSDLLFSILPRQGKVPMAHDEQKVRRISKQASLRELNDEEKELNAEEREAREKQQRKEKQAKPSDQQENKDVDEESTQQENQPPHLDIYV